MTKKELIAEAGGMPILNITDFLLDQLKAVGRAEKIGENGQNWEAYRVGSLVCVNGPKCPITEAICERVYVPGRYADDGRTPEEIIQRTGLGIKVKRGFKTWGWLAEKVIESELTGKPLKAIFRPYNQYGGKWASRSYYNIPSGLNDVCERLGIIYDLKNDAPRGGKAGDYLEFRKAKKMRLLYCIHQNFDGVGESYDFASFEAETKEGQKPDPQEIDRLIGMWKQLSKKTIKQWYVDGVGVYVINKNRLVDNCLKFITNEELEAME